MYAFPKDLGTKWSEKKKNNASVRNAIVRKLNGTSAKDAAKVISALGDLYKKFDKGLAKKLQLTAASKTQDQMSKRAEEILQIATAYKKVISQAQPHNTADKWATSFMAVLQDLDAFLNGIVDHAKSAKAGKSVKFDHVSSSVQLRETMTRATRPLGRLDQGTDRKTVIEEWQVTCKTIANGLGGKYTLLSTATEDPELRQALKSALSCFTEMSEEVKKQRAGQKTVYVQGTAGAEVLDEVETAMLKVLAEHRQRVITYAKEVGLTV